MSNKDYSEVFLQSTEQIVDSKLSMVKFDQTIICTVIDDSNAFNGEYQVSDGSVTFTAYSENRNYMKNMQVYVLIPQGNWANKKQITALYSKSESAVINYVSELEKLMVVSSVSIDDDGKEDFADGGVRYSDDENQPPCVVFIPSASVDIEPNYNTELTNTLCIRFKLQTQKFSTDDLSDYQFGVKVSIYPRHYGESTPNEEESISFDYTNNKMLGNPFYYFTPTQQEIVYHIDSKLMPFIGHIGLELIREEDNTSENNTALMDIKITDIQIYLCHDVSQYENNTVLLFPIYNNNTYDSSEEDYDDLRNVQIIWINKNMNGRYIGFTDGEFNKEKATEKSKEITSTDYDKKYYYIEWYNDTPYKRLDLITYIDEETGEEIIKPGERNYQPKLLTRFTDTKIQAKVWVNGENYESKILTFKNENTSSNLIEETLKRLNGGEILNCAGEKNPNYTGGAGHVGYHIYPTFTAGTNQGKAIQFTKKMKIIKSSLDSVEEGAQKADEEEKINFSSILSEPGSEYNPWTEVDDNLTFSLTDGKILHLENEILISNDENTYFVESCSFNNISSLCFVSDDSEEQLQVEQPYIINDTVLMKRLAEAEARIQQLEKQLSAYI